MKENRELSDLAAGYALGTLTPEEAVAYEAFLADSADARNIATVYESTAAALGLDAPCVLPSPELKADIMALIAVTPQLKTSEQEQDTPEQALVQSAAEARDRPSATQTTGPASAKARARWSKTPVRILAGAAAAVVLFAGGTLVGVNVNSDNNRAVQLQQATALARINAAPDVQRATANVSSGGTATLVWSDSLETSAILVNDLGLLPADKTYELWYIRGDEAHPAGTMEAATANITWRVLEGKKTPGDVIGITVEPTGGSEQPTTTPVVTVPS